MTLTDRIEKYWDDRSDKFSETRLKELKSKNAPAWQRLITECIGQDKPLKILDIGTGAGFFAILLASAGHEVTGIDMSNGMVKQAQKNTASLSLTASFLKMNAQELDFHDDSFDVIVTRNLTWTLPDLPAAYTEWHRVLKPNGKLLNFDADYGTIRFEKKDKPDDVHAGIEMQLIDECNYIKDNLSVSTHRRPTWDRELLNEAGFTAVEINEDIRPLVFVDEHMQYDNLPVFSIMATK